MKLLEPYIKKIWFLENPDLPYQPQSFRFFADGCPGLMFQQSENGMFLNQDKKLAAFFLYGQTVKPIEITVTGRFAIILIHFYPYAIKPIFGINANEVTDTCLDINLLSGYSSKNITDRLLNAPSINQQIELIKSYLIHLIRSNYPDPNRALQHAVFHLMESNGTIPLKKLQLDLQLSERAIERRFNQHVGVSPKLFSRICRFQATLERLKSGHYRKLSDLAYDYGYADHSHFIRFFREFTGFSPLEFQKQPESSVEMMHEK